MHATPGAHSAQIDGEILIERLLELPAGPQLLDLASSREDVDLVGGAVRDRLLGRPTTDYDVAVEGDPKRLARALAQSTDAHAFSLSESFGAWRVIARDHSWQVDLLPLAERAIEADLSQRDLTINAIAETGGAIGVWHFFPSLDKYVEGLKEMADVVERRTHPR